MTCGPRVRISPSGAMATSTPAIGRPTVPMRKCSGVFTAMTGDVSVSPYPSRMMRPAEKKNLLMSGASGAPPDTK